MLFDDNIAKLFIGVWVLLNSLWITPDPLKRVKFYRQFQSHRLHMFNFDLIVAGFFCMPARG